MKCGLGCLESSVSKGSIYLSARSHVRACTGGGLRGDGGLCTRGMDFGGIRGAADFGIAFVGGGGETARAGDREITRDRATRCRNEVVSARRGAVSRCEGVPRPARSAAASAEPLRCRRVASRILEPLNAFRRCVRRAVDSPAKCVREWRRWYYAQDTNARIRRQYRSCAVRPGS